jgi:hypothetical protein
MNHLYPDYDPSLVRPRHHRPSPNLASGSPAHVPHSSQASPSTGDAIPDMGILKALQGVGEGVRQQLNQLAVQFNQTATAALETIEGKRSRSGSLSGGGGDSFTGEMRPLTATDYEEEDEDEQPLMSSSNLTRRSQTHAKKDK